MDQAKVHRQAALTRSPDLPQPKAALAALLSLRGAALLMLGRTDEAVAEANRLKSLRPGHGDDQVNAARLLARAALATTSNRAESYTRQALELLRQAPKAGPIKLHPRTDDADFSALRRYPEFPLLLMDIAMPLDVFTGPTP